MVANSRLPLITKASRNLFIDAKEHPNNLKNLRYIPDWYVKREHCGSYNDFTQKMQTFYPDFSLKKLVAFVKKEGEKIGEGRHAETYSIPQIDDYIIRINRKKSLGFFSRVKKLKKTPDNYYGFNFGQPIASNNDGISIHLRAIGEEYGISNWYSCVQSKKKPTQQEAHHYIEHDLALLSEFPQESYDDFIKRICFIKRATPYDFDFINPNNFVIDYKNKKINIVDTCHKDESNFWDSDINKIPSSLCNEDMLFFAQPIMIEKAEEYIHKIRTKSRIALDMYQASYPSVKWQESPTPIEKLQKSIKKILENISLRIRAKHFGKKIENLNKLD